MSFFKKNDDCYFSKEDRESIKENFKVQLAKFALRYIELSGSDGIESNVLGTFSAGVTWGLAKALQGKAEQSEIEQIVLEGFNEFKKELK